MGLAIIKGSKAYFACQNAFFVLTYITYISCIIRQNGIIMRFYTATILWVGKF